MLYAPLVLLVALEPVEGASSSETAAAASAPANDDVGSLAAPLLRVESTSEAVGNEEPAAVNSTQRR